jgi:spore maturation protein CgeB
MRSARSSWNSCSAFAPRRDAMKIVIFGLTISSAWANGHATLWRALCRALDRRGHDVVFLERDVPYYAQHRDETSPAGCRLRLYTDWDAVAADAGRELEDADVGMVTSYCPDARAACRLLLDSHARVKSFYDLDTPVTLERLHRDGDVEYVPPYGLSEFDLVLSYTGGRALDALRNQLGARRVAALYGSVDPDRHFPVSPDASRQSNLSYLGTYSPDRQSALEKLFIEPARQRSALRFALAGSQYPPDFPWLKNIFYLRHMPPGDHPSFFCSSALTLNVTRGPMAEMGYCPSGRLFEAAACGVPLLSDWWEGLDAFFTPHSEILIASTTEDAVAALDASEGERRRIASAARARTLACHTADHRAMEFEHLMEAAAHPLGEVC